MANGHAPWKEKETENIRMRCEWTIKKLIAPKLLNFVCKLDMKSLKYRVSVWLLIMIIELKIMREIIDRIIDEIW